jgi:segregation and condensation protein B
MTHEHSLGASLPGAKEIMEALFFATDEPLTPKQVVEIFQMLDENERPYAVSEDTVLSLIEELNREYEQSRRSFRIVKVAGGYQFATQPVFAPWLGRMMKEKIRRKLSASALESLAVIAYKQPVTKPEIEAIRGVNADYVIHSLLERNLITIVGRAATPGRPLLYGTTKDFLKHFGLNDLSELPKPREIDELMAEAQFEVEKRILADLEAKSAVDHEEEEAKEAGDEDSSESRGTIVVDKDGTLRELRPSEKSDQDPMTEDPD